MVCNISAEIFVNKNLNSKLELEFKTIWPSLESVKRGDSTAWTVSLVSGSK